MHKHRHAHILYNIAKLCHFKANESDPALHSSGVKVTLKANFVNLHSQALNGIKSEGRMRKRNAIAKTKSGQPLKGKQKERIMEVRGESAAGSSY